MKNHQMSFQHESKKNETELSKHLWQLKDQKKDFAISWKILARPNLIAILLNDVTFVAPRNSIFYTNQTWQRLTNVTNSYQLVGTSESFSSNSITSSRTNHKFTNVYYYCSSSLNSVTIILLMYINPSDASVYMEFNWWVDQRFVGLRNRPVLKSIWNNIE